MSFQVTFEHTLEISHLIAPIAAKNLEIKVILRHIFRRIQIQSHSNVQTVGNSLHLSHIYASMGNPVVEGTRLK